MNFPKHSPAEDEPEKSTSQSPAIVSENWLIIVKKTAILQAVLMILVCVPVILKYAATNFPFKSWQYLSLFAICFGILGLYAIVWQKVLKSFTLIEAYSNKAISGFWFLILGYFLFGDTVSIWNFVGLLIITFGVTRLYARTEIPIRS